VEDLMSRIAASSSIRRMTLAISEPGTPSSRSRCMTINRADDDSPPSMGIMELSGLVGSEVSVDKLRRLAFSSSSGK